ncbi:SCO family protein [Frankia sp. AgPm24]|uniref:SCO family protein n=1 Tax=Frankia sp. AgPm24 TaxID=631128 RepID=UPI00200E2439|nr:SCO family protein [Frankia sp. AgPm24]MCK9922578.1 SCO family protein [Frankia sp. AgPm24]
MDATPPAEHPPAEHQTAEPQTAEPQTAEPQTAEHRAADSPERRTRGGGQPSGRRGGGRRRAVPRVGVGALALGLALAFALTGCGGGSATSADANGVIVHLDDATDASGLRGTSLAAPMPKPDVRLTDTGGQPYDLRAATTGKLTLVYFGYSHCPDVCPTTMADIAAGLSETSAAVQQKVSVVFITTDPERDTPAVLHSWLAQFNPAFVGLTGTWEQIAGYADQFGIPVEKPRQQADGSWVVDHGSQVTAFGPDGVARVVYLAGITPADYAHDLPTLVKGA